MFKITQTLGNFTLIKDVIIVVLFLKAFAMPLWQQTLPYRRNMFGWPIVALLAYMAVAFVMADSLTLGILRAREIGLYILLYAAVLYMSYSREIYLRRVRWFLSSAAVLLLAGLYQWFFAGDAAVLRFDPVRSIWIPRISSTFAHPSVFGEYLILVSALLAAISFTVKKRRIQASLGMIAILPFIYLTYSRGVWLGYVCTALSLCVAAIMAKRTWKATFTRAWIAGFAGAVLVLVILLVRFSPVGGFIQTAFDPSYASNQIRLDFLARLIASTSNAQAIFGHGLGDIDQKLFSGVPLDVNTIAAGDSRGVQLAKDSTLVDNQYLKTFIEMGIVGMLIYAWVYFLGIKVSWRLAGQEIRNKKLEIRIIGLSALGFFTAFIVQALFVDIWDVFPTNLAFWIVAAHLSQAAIDNTPVNA
ncbi:MAG: O-antigen ligase family protein [Candidatus Andersenbacteria bacterium]|nr:O-antigen ligase family protein [Candidatus Andersenbacteria bacterium]